MPPPHPGILLLAFALNPVSIVVLTVLTAIWLQICRWTDRDADFVNTLRQMWNMIVFGTGLLGLCLLLLIPSFAAGTVMFILLVGGGFGAYLTHRNTLVVDEAKVATPGHLLRIIRREGAGRAARGVTERIRLTDSTGRQVPVPTEHAEAKRYAAVQDLLFDVLWRRASDVNLVPAGAVARVAYRIDGVVTEREAMQRERFEHVLEYLKRLGGLEREERRRPQQGKITAAVHAGQDSPGSMVEVEVRTSGSTQGEQMVLRVLAEEARFRLPDIGLNPDQLKQLTAILEQPNGVVLVAGPRQSGLSTTLYAILRTHDAFMRNINTLEASKLMDLENITQKVFDANAEASYARQLLSIIRRDPDIIMVGECPNRETAQLMAKHSAKKKFYLGLSSHDTFDALRRWSQLVVDNEMVAMGLKAIVAQRLIRKLCPACRQSYHPDPGLLKKANLPAGSVFYRPPQQQPTRRGKPVVCSNCQAAGYLGRSGLFEVMTVDGTLRKLIQAGAPLKAMSQVKAACRKAGMVYLQEQGIHKVQDGTTSMEEVLRVVQPPARPKAAETA